MTDLTRRERLILSLILTGMTPQQIARCLGVSHKTVRGQLASMYRKLNVRSRTHMVAVMWEAG
jgi:LuxR family maltose regulon positive regulatory protein